MLTLQSLKKKDLDLLKDKILIEQMAIKIIQVMTIQ